MLRQESQTPPKSGSGKCSSPLDDASHIADVWRATRKKPRSAPFASLEKWTKGSNVCSPASQSAAQRIVL
jgi:hypothetical protein